MCDEPSSWRAEQPLPEFLAQRKIVAIQGIDTRRSRATCASAGDARGHLDDRPGADSLVAKARPPRASQDLVRESPACRTAGTIAVRQRSAGETGVLPVKPNTTSRDDRHQIQHPAPSVRSGCELTVFLPTMSAEDPRNSSGRLFFANGLATVAVDTCTTLRSYRHQAVFDCLGHQLLSLAVANCLPKTQVRHRVATSRHEPAQRRVRSQARTTLCVDSRRSGSWCRGQRRLDVCRR